MLPYSNFKFVRWHVHGDLPERAKMLHDSMRVDVSSFCFSIQTAVNFGSPIQFKPIEFKFLIVSMLSHSILNSSCLSPNLCCSSYDFFHSRRHASLAQSVARRSHNPKVMSSILIGSIFYLCQFWTATTGWFVSMYRILYCCLVTFYSFVFLTCVHNQFLHLLHKQSPPCSLFCDNNQHANKGKIRSVWNLGTLVTSIVTHALRMQHWKNYKQH